MDRILSNRLTSHRPIPRVAEGTRRLRKAVHLEAFLAAGAVLLGGFEVVALCPRVGVVRRSQVVGCKQGKGEIRHAKCPHGE